jgi:hypothetical protein
LHLNRLIGSLAAKNRFGFIKCARSIVEEHAPAIVTLRYRKKNVANARLGKANGQIARTQFRKAYEPHGVLARNSVTRPVAPAQRLNKVKQREAFVGGVRSSEGQSSENDRNRQRAR